MNLPNTVLAPNTNWPIFQFRPQPRTKVVDKPVRVFKARNLGLTDHILDYLETNPSSYAVEVSRALNRDCHAVATTLSRLQKQNRVRSELGERYSGGGFQLKKFWRTE